LVAGSDSGSTSPPASYAGRWCRAIAPGRYGARFGTMTSMSIPFPALSLYCW